MQPHYSIEQLARLSAPTDQALCTHTAHVLRQSRQSKVKLFDQLTCAGLSICKEATKDEKALVIRQRAKKLCLFNGSCVQRIRRVKSFSS